MFIAAGMTRGGARATPDPATPVVNLVR